MPEEFYQIQGAVLIDNASLERDELCFYLPLNDSAVEYNPQKRFNFFRGKYATRQRAGGKIEITEVIGGSLRSRKERSRPHVLAIDTLPSENLLIRFKTRLPRWGHSDPDQFQAVNFFPIPMTSCGGKIEAAFATALNTKYRLQLRYPSDWLVASNASELSVQQSVGPFGQRLYEYTGEKISLAFGRKFRRKIIRQTHYYLEIFHSTDDFLNLMEPMLDILNYHSELFGHFPFRKLVVVESSELENSELPGMIFINQPKNASATGAQQYFTNWTVWQLSYFAAEQWFGGAIKYRSSDDYWLFKGINDFATYRALKRIKEGFDFFRSYDDKPPRFTFNYRQSQDLLAAVLTFFQDRNALVTKAFTSKKEQDDQHPLSYVRHSLAMRQIDWALGSKTVEKMMSELSFRSLGKRLTPEGFLNFSFKETPQKYVSLFKDHLAQWWQQDEWPDFYLDSVSESKLDGDIYRVDIDVKESGRFRFPLQIEVVDEDGKVQQKKIYPDEGNWTAVFHLTAPVDTVSVDPEKEVFDWNRFNNSDRSSNWYLFPGSARTLYDDEYTVLWFPMIGKLPGDDLTFYLSAQFMRYIHDGVTAIVNYSPKVKKAGFFLMHESLLIKLGGYSLFKVEQDSALNRGERIVEWNIVKTPLLSGAPLVKLGFIAKHRQTLNKKDSAHEVLGAEIGITPLNRRQCNYDIRLQSERSVATRSPDLGYIRSFSLFDGNCQFSKNVDLAIRGFYGSLTGKLENAPENVFFQPQNIQEAKIRIPTPRLQGVKRMSSGGIDVLLPAYLGLDGIVLAKQMRWRLFYDYGRAYEENFVYRNAGFGLYMPLGGDLVGKGGVSLLRFSLLYVPYVKVSGDKSAGSGVLFDFFGRL